MSIILPQMSVLYWNPGYNELTINSFEIKNKKRVENLKSTFDAVTSEKYFLLLANLSMFTLKTVKELKYFLIFS